jgi:hypothetical protein
VNEAGIIASFLRKEVLTRLPNLAKGSELDVILRVSRVSLEH